MQEFSGNYIPMSYRRQARMVVPIAGSDKNGIFVLIHTRLYRAKEISRSVVSLFFYYEFQCQIDEAPRENRERFAD